MCFPGLLKTANRLGLTFIIAKRLLADLRIVSVNQSVLPHAKK